MNRVWMAAAGLTIAIGVMLNVQPVVAMDSAIVIKNNGLCGMVGSDADGAPIFGGIGQVETSIENGNKLMIKCKGSDIANPTGRGQSFRGFECGIETSPDDFEIVTDSHAAVSASGVGTLTCTFKKDAK